MNGFTITSASYNSATMTVTVQGTGSRPVTVQLWTGTPASRVKYGSPQTVSPSGGTWTATFTNVPAGSYLASADSSDGSGAVTIPYP
jgi:hypothetical protein